MAFRRQMLLLPLNVYLHAQKASFPHLTRSVLPRCRQRHDTKRMPEMTGDKPAKPKFKPCRIGCFHIGMAEGRTEEASSNSSSGSTGT